LTVGMNLLESLFSHNNGRRGAGPANRTRHGSETREAPQTPKSRFWSETRRALPEVFH
jgi:hypothetical protein